MFDSVKVKTRIFFGIFFKGNQGVGHVLFSDLTVLLFPVNTSASGRGSDNDGAVFVSLLTLACIKLRALLGNVF